MSIKFYFQYSGTKRNDMKFIKDAINLNKIKRIVEPFCGSCAFSLYCYRELDFKGEIILNDIDKNLIEFYKDVKNNSSEKYFKFVIDKFNTGKITKEEHSKLINEDKYKSLLNWFYFKRYDGKFRNQLNNSITIKKYQKNKDVIKSLDNFFQDKNIKLYNCDYTDIINKYKDDKYTLFYLDPPFFNSYNAGYTKYYKNLDEHNNIIDNTKIYIDIIELLKFKNKVIVSINDNSLIRYLYKDYIFKDFKKIYQVDKKKEGQLILKN